MYPSLCVNRHVAFHAVQCDRQCIIPILLFLVTKECKQCMPSVLSEVHREKNLHSRPKKNNNKQNNENNSVMYNVATHNASGSTFFFAARIVKSMYVLEQRAR